MALSLESMRRTPHHLHSFEPDGQNLEDYFYSWNRNNLIIGPLGSGKTFCSIYKLLTIITQQPPDKWGVRRSRIMVMRNFENDIIGTTLKDWLQIVPSNLGHITMDSPITHWLKFTGPDGIPVRSEVIFFPLDRPESTFKLRGYQLTALYLSEAKELKREVITMAQSRLGRYPAVDDMPGFDPRSGIAPYWYGTIGDSNQVHDDHWLYETIHVPTYEELKNWSIYVQPGGVVRTPEGGWAPNPNAENLSKLTPGYYMNQLANTRNNTWIAVNLGNEYGSVTEGERAWPEYVPDLHETDKADFDPRLPVYGGIDYGRTPAAVLMQEQNGGYLIFDEFCTRDVSAVLFAPALKQHLMKRWGLSVDDVEFYDDPSGSTKKENDENSAHDVMRSWGFNVTPAPVPDNNTYLRRSAMILPLTRMTITGRPAIQICKQVDREYGARCRTIRMGATSKFYYRKLQISYDDMYSGDVVKNHYSHVCEAGEYALLGRGEGMPSMPGGGSGHTSSSQRPDARFG